MRIACISFDDVNRFLIRRWTRRPVTRLAADGVVLDLDSLPVALRAAWIAEAAAGTAGRVLAHGHTITDAEADELRRAGVLVVRGTLRRAVFLTWLRDLRRVEALARRTLLDAPTEPVGGGRRLLRQPVLGGTA